EPKSVEPKSVEPKSVEPKSVEPKSVKPKSVEPKSVKPKSVEPKSVEPKSVEPKSVEPKSVALNNLNLNLNLPSESSQSESSNNKVADPRVNNKTHRADFIRQCLADDCFIRKIDKLGERWEVDSPWLWQIEGVSCVILDKDKGEVSVLLGKEQGGIYEGKLNFIGGKIEKDNFQDRLEAILATLYDEVREELGIQLQYNPFNKSLIHIKLATNEEFGTLMFFCYISGLSVKSWEIMNRKRLAQNVRPKYREFSEIKFLPIKALSADRNDISDYVHENINQIVEASKHIQGIGVPRSDFLLVKDDIPMMGSTSK
ncbi:MAG: hypothetical protein K2X94_02290, partial [Amoebophilaceae bacterium]|nr:hypothetical protein [Amoebophilaceae bacterium]